MIQLDHKIMIPHLYRATQILENHLIDFLLASYCTNTDGRVAPQVIFQTLILWQLITYLNITGREKFEVFTADFVRICFFYFVTISYDYMIMGLVYWCLPASHAEIKCANYGCAFTAPVRRQIQTVICSSHTTRRHVFLLLIGLQTQAQPLPHF